MQILSNFKHVVLQKYPSIDTFANFTLCISPLLSTQIYLNHLLSLEQKLFTECIQYKHLLYTQFSSATCFLPHSWWFLTYSDPHGESNPG